jgi:hypothetical protein
MREVVADALHEVTSPRPIQNIECMRQLADILKFILTLFVHEQTTDQRLLSAIIESSGHLYHLAANRRKLYLHSLLEDHGIWHGDAKAWKEVI